MSWRRQKQAQTHVLTVTCPVIGALKCAGTLTWNVASLSFNPAPPPRPGFLLVLPSFCVCASRGGTAGTLPLPLLSAWTYLPSHHFPLEKEGQMKGQKPCSNPPWATHCTAVHGSLARSLTCPQPPFAQETGKETDEEEGPRPADLPT